MSQKYLLPCECGKVHPVDGSQAGLAVICECGRELEVPTLAGIRKLQPAEVTVAAPQKSWGAAQGLIFLGSVMLGLGLAVAAYFYLNADKHRPDVAEIHERIDLGYRRLTPTQVWAIEWRDLKRGLDVERSDPFDLYLHLGELYAARSYRWAWTGLAVAGIGTVILAIGAIVVAGTRRSPARR